MHIVALGYPTKPSYAEKRAAKEFFESFTHLIPCPTCKLHYADNLKENPVTPSLDTKEDLFRWTVKMHNMVNKQLGKPELQELDAIAFYHKLGALGRSPIWTPQDIQAYEFASAAKLGLAALGGAALAGAVYYWVTEKRV